MKPQPDVKKKGNTTRDPCLKIRLLNTRNQTPTKELNKETKNKKRDERLERKTTTC